MFLHFHGAADGVTGSLHRVHVGDVDTREGLATALEEAGVIMAEPGGRIELS